MKEKIKILFLPSDLAGVGHFRSIWPAQEMQKTFKDEFEIKIIPNYDFKDLEPLKKYDIIHFHRQLGPFEKIDKIFNELKEAGVTLIMDIDDFWAPPTTHPLYQVVKENNINEIDYIKIDVEGGDFMVLKGCEKMLETNKIKMGQFEIGIENEIGISIDEITSFLEKFGYSIDKSFKSDYVFYS
jgi:hypothetical protein